MSTPDKAPDNAPGNTPGKTTRTDPKVLEALVCPRSKTLLTYDEEKHELTSKQSGRAYPIRHGIPVMVTAAAREV